MGHVGKRITHNDIIGCRDWGGGEKYRGKGHRGEERDRGERQIERKREREREKERERERER